MNNLSAFLPEKWAPLVVEKLYQSNVALAVLANNNYEGTVSGAGSTVWVRTFGRITTAKYTRGQPISFQNLAPSKESLTINDADHFAFMVDDLDNVQADIDIYGGYTREGAIAIGEIVDTKVFSYVTSAATANQITSGGSAITITSSTATTAIVELLGTAAANLDAQNAPQEGRWVVVSPGVKKLMLLDTKYLVRAAALGDSIITSGRIDWSNGNYTMTARTAPNFIGQVAGFDIYWSNNLPKDGSGNRYLPYGVGKPIAYVNQFQNVETVRPPEYFATAIKGLILHDGAVFTEMAKRLGYILCAAAVG